MQRLLHNRAHVVPRTARTDTLLNLDPICSVSAVSPPHPIHPLPLISNGRFVTPRRRQEKRAYGFSSPSFFLLFFASSQKCEFPAGHTSTLLNHRRPTDCMMIQATHTRARTQTPPGEKSDGTVRSGGRRARITCTYVQDECGVRAPHSSTRLR